MNHRPPHDPAEPQPAKGARAGRRSAVAGSARRRAWAGSAVLSLAVHAGALGLVGWLALVPRLTGSDTETAGVRLPWTASLDEVAEAEPWNTEPLTAEAEEVELPFLESDPSPTPMPWSEPPPPRLEQLPEDPPVDPRPPRPEPVETEVEEVPEPIPVEPDPQPADPQPEGESAPEGEAPDLGGDSEPVLEDAPPPKYPRLARVRGWEGVVEVRITVAADGRVTDVQIETSSGHTLLDDSALEAVRQWRFKPGLVEGIAAERVVLHRVHFTLSE